MKKSYKFLMMTALLGIAYALDHIHRAAGLIPLLSMAWPTTGATGNGNAATGQYVANGTGTTLLWGTNGILPNQSAQNFLTVTKLSERTIVAFKENLPNGDGLTAGQVIGIDGILVDIEVRDDVNQNTSSIVVGTRIYIYDNGGLVPGGARGAQYSGIITAHDWDAAPRTPAGRRLAVEKYLLIT